VDKFTIKREGKESELLPTGTKISAKSGEEGTVFESDGKPLDAKVSEALSLVITLDGGSQKPTDDDMYGSVTRRKVGERWSVHKGALITSLHAEGMDVRAEDVAGTMTLAQVLEQKEGKPMALTMKLRLQNLKMPSNEGLDVKEASSVVEGLMEAPTDVTKGPLKESQRAVRTIHATKMSKEGKEIAISSTGAAYHTIEYSYPAKSK
jgi:hypothetical protein